NHSLFFMGTSGPGQKGIPQLSQRRLLGGAELRMPHTGHSSVPRGATATGVGAARLTWVGMCNGVTRGSARGGLGAGTAGTGTAAGIGRGAGATATATGTGCPAGGAANAAAIACGTWATGLACGATGGLAARLP